MISQFPQRHPTQRLSAALEPPKTKTSRSQGLLLNLAGEARSVVKFPGLEHISRPLRVNGVSVAAADHQGDVGQTTGRGHVDSRQDHAEWGRRPGSVIERVPDAFPEDGAVDY